MDAQREVARHLPNRRGPPSVVYSIATNGLVVQHRGCEGYHRLRFRRALALVKRPLTGAWTAWRWGSHPVVGRRTLSWGGRRGSRPGLDPPANALAAIWRPLPGVGGSRTASFRSRRRASAGAKASHRAAGVGVFRLSRTTRLTAAVGHCPSTTACSQDATSFAGRRSGTLTCRPPGKGGPNLHRGHGPSRRYASAYRGGCPGTIGRGWGASLTSGDGRSSTQTPGDRGAEGSA